MWVRNNIILQEKANYVVFVKDHPDSADTVRGITLYIKENIKRHIKLIIENDI